MMILLFFWILLLTRVGQEVGADTITVNDDGGADFQKIQDAINASQDGDTIRVWEGTYAENVVVNTSVDIIGNGSDVTLLMGDRHGRAFYLKGISYSTIENLRIENYQFGMYLDDSHYHNFTNIAVLNCSVDGIYLEDSDHNILTNISIWNCAGNGIYLRSSEDNILTNSTISNIGQYGINLRYYSNGNILTENTISKNRYGIYFSGHSTGNSFTRNTVSINNKYGIDFSVSEHNTLTDNTISKNQYGIYLHDLSNDNNLINNSIMENSIGIFVTENSKRNIAHFNHIYDNTEFGINASSDSIINATDNWWGHRSGPHHPTGNPEGRGDDITDHVLFDPWTGKPHTWHVDDDAPSGGDGSEENPFDEIQDAIDAAEDGDIIYIHEGIYGESIVNKPLNLTGENRESTFTGYMGFEGNGGISITNLTIEHVMIENNCHKNIIINCSFINSESGINIDGGRNNTISNCTFENNEREGIQVSGTSGNTIEFCTFENCGIFISCDTKEDYLSNDIRSTTVNGKDLIVLKNMSGFTYQENAGQLILMNCSNGTIKNQNISSSDVGIHVIYSSNVNIRDCDITDNGGVGIYLIQSKNCIIDNCIIQGNEIGMFLRGSNKNTVKNCNIFDNHWGSFGGGIYLRESSHNTISNCRIHDNHSRNSYGIMMIQGCNNNSIMSCIISHNTNGVSLKYDCKGTNVQSCNILDNEEFGIEVTYNDGYMVNATNNWWGDTSGPYHPQNNSQGKGDNITDSVEFEPWLEKSIFPITLYVSNSAPAGGDGSVEHPFTKIQDAINAAKNGDTIRVYEGIYCENIVVNKSVSLIGNGSANTTIDGGENGDVVSIQNDWVNITGFSIIKSDSERKVGLRITANHTNIYNNKFTDNGVGIQIEEGYYNTISGNDCTSYYRNIRLAFSDFNIINNNYCTGCYYGIYFHYSNNNTAKDNSLPFNDYSFYLFYSNNNSIIRNNCTDNSNSGIRPANSHNNIFSGNNISNNHGGIDLYMCNFSLITNNIISSNSYNGIRLHLSNENEITHNVITSHTIGINIRMESSLNIVHFNEITDNSEFGIDASENDGVIVNASYNWWGHPSGPYHASENPEGDGDEVTDFVHFHPWFREQITWYVDDNAPSGGDGSVEHPFNKIQNAIDHAYPGWRIRIFDGTYDEMIEIDKPLKIIGNSSSSTIIDGHGASYVIGIGANWVEVSALTIRNASECGISITNSTGITVTDCIIADTPLDFNLTNSHITLVNTPFSTVAFTDSYSIFSVFWPIELRVTDDHSGFIPDAHVKIADSGGSLVFDGYTDETGRIESLIQECSINLSFRTEYNPYTISIRKDGYLNFTVEVNATSYTRFSYQLETHILPHATISGELIRHVDMDSVLFLDGSESTGRSITYLWNLSDGNTSSSPTPSHVYTAPGVYQVDLTVTDDYENTSTASIAVIVENVLPTVSIEADATATFEDTMVTFDASGSWDTPSDSLFFLWDFGDGSQSSEITPTHSFTEAGEYMVSLSVSDSFGGESSAILSISVMNIAPWDVSAGEDKTTFTNFNVEFHGSANDTPSDIDDLLYTWDFGDGDKAHGMHVTHSYSRPGIYVITFTVTDDNNASGYGMINVTVREPEIVWTIMNEWNFSDTIISQDDTLYFSASHELDDGSFLYHWHFGDGYHAEGRNASHLFTMSGLFIPLVEIFDGVENTTQILPEITVLNNRPTAYVNHGSPWYVNESQDVEFNASTSFDSPSDMDSLTYLWDLGDGTFEYGWNVTHSYSLNQGYIVTLMVSDGKETSTAGIFIIVQNLPPAADAGWPKERTATLGETVILDASGSTDTPSDVHDLNYTWIIGNDTIHGMVVSYTFTSSGTFPVVLQVRDNDGAISEDTITFQVSKPSEGELEGMMNGPAWILLIIVIVFLGVILLLLSQKLAFSRMEIGEVGGEEVEGMEGAEIATQKEIYNEMFKPPEENEAREPNGGDW